MTRTPDRRKLIASLCSRLQALQRERRTVIASRNMIYGRLQHIVAGTLGYDSGIKNDKKRKELFKQADELIESVCDGRAESTFREIILRTMMGVEPLDTYRKELEKQMRPIADQLPVMEWASHIRGFGKTSSLFLAIVIGETGDLFNYANPAKVWRRMGCAPWEFNGHTRMGASWRKKLPAEEWSKFGYSPRRRSVAYLVGVNIVKLNDGIYRDRYKEAKRTFHKKHKEASKMHCHRHGMLLATKMLLRDLWVEWNK